MGIPSQEEYERSERSRMDAEEGRINRAPLRERQEARADFQEAMASDPAAVAERVGWLIDGNYGRGQYAAARETVANPRLNREGILCLLVGVFEYQCPRVMGTDAWKKLTISQKKALSEAIAVVISEAEGAEV
jgi:hypothetical protein